jgi:hypothetical protein
MIQCPEAHLFCGNCMRAHASSLLGTQNPDIKCFDLSGCNALIPESELRRFLPDEMLRLWERARQRKDIQSANLKGLEECPFCDYSVIIEFSEERLLRCGNKDVCGMVSCRACKKPVSTFRFVPWCFVTLHHLHAGSFTAALWRSVFNHPTAFTPLMHIIGYRRGRRQESGATTHRRRSYECVRCHLKIFLLLHLFCLISCPYLGRAMVRSCPSCNRCLSSFFWPQKILIFLRFSAIVKTDGVWCLVSHAVGKPLNWFLF